MTRPLSNYQASRTAAWAASAVSLGGFWLLRDLQDWFDAYSRDRFTLAAFHYHYHASVGYVPHTWFASCLSWAIWTGMRVLPYLFVVVGVGVLARWELARRTLVVCCVLAILVEILRIVQLPLWWAGLSEAVHISLHGILFLKPLHLTAPLRRFEFDIAIATIAKVALEAAYCILLARHLLSVRFDARAPLPETP